MTTNMDENTKVIVDSKKKSSKASVLRVRTRESSARKRENKRSLPKLKESTNIREFIVGGTKGFKVYVEDGKGKKEEKKEKEVQTDPVKILEEAGVSEVGRVEDPKNGEKLAEGTSVSSHSLTPTKTTQRITSTPTRSRGKGDGGNGDTGSGASEGGVKEGKDEKLEDEIMRLGEDSDEVYKLLTGEDVPENYWKMLAETRREALNESLQENKELHEELTKLKGENSILIEILSKNESYSSILENALEKESALQSSDEEEEEESDAAAGDDDDDEDED